MTVTYKRGGLLLLLIHAVNGVNQQQNLTPSLVHTQRNKLRFPSRTGTPDGIRQPYNTFLEMVLAFPRNEVVYYAVRSKAQTYRSASWLGRKTKLRVFCDRPSLSQKAFFLIAIFELVMTQIMIYLSTRSVYKQLQWLPK